MSWTKRSARLRASEQIKKSKGKIFVTLTKEVENTGEFRNNNKKKSMAIEFLKFQGNFSKLSTYYIVFFTPYLFQIDKIHFDVTHFCVQNMYVELSRVLNLAILNRYECKVMLIFLAHPV